MQEMIWNRKNLLSNFRRAICLFLYICMFIVLCVIFLDMKNAYYVDANNINELNLPEFTNLSALGTVIAIAIVEMPGVFVM